MVRVFIVFPCSNNTDDSHDDEDLQVYKVFAALTCGATENIDLFVRAGIGHAEGENVISDGDDLDFGSTEFTWGAGARATLIENEKCKWGAVVTYSQFKSEEHDGGEIVDFDELEIAFGPTIELSNDVSIYGGPLFHHVNGNWKDRGDDATGSLNEDGFGGYMGARFRVNENSFVSPEFQFTDDAVGFGICFICSI